MEKYDYLSAVTADVKDYINDNVNFADSKITYRTNFGRLTV